MRGGYNKKDIAHADYYEGVEDVVNTSKQAVALLDTAGDSFAVVPAGDCQSKYYTMAVLPGEYSHYHCVFPQAVVCVVSSMSPHSSSVFSLSSSNSG